MSESFHQLSPQGHAASLRLALGIAAKQLGEDKVFMDEDGIPYGDRFLRVIAERLSTCVVFQSIIGPGAVIIAIHMIFTRDQAGVTRQPIVAKVSDSVVVDLKTRQIRTAKPT
jgi:hypothetical protein